MVFIGAVEEGWQILNSILAVPDHRNDLVSILTLKREKLENVSDARDFADLAIEHSIPLYKIDHINNPESVALLKRLKPHLLLVFGWSQLLSAEVLAIPRLGAIGLHSTLLPKHRGRAPIPWAIIKGLSETGNTLLYLDEGVDSGDIIAQQSFEITLDDNAASVYAKSVRSGIDLVREYLPHIKLGAAPRIPQHESEADYWPRRRPQDGLIHWNNQAKDVYNLIRGVTHPYPGAFTFDRGKKLFIWAARLPDADASPALTYSAQPGTILMVDDGGITVSTSDRFLMVTSVQPPDQEEMSAKSYAFLSGLQTGMKWATTGAAI
ncbi:MAG: methionyl-tRNA formyltransferase [Chloroflexi bacterium]|nr:methionyl-tRNA formyltransferase [Chloroflexota bacterium]